MIAVVRTEEPIVLKKHAARWLAELKAAKVDPNVAQSQIEKATNKYRHRQIKESLVEMFHGKCAYCESRITVVTYGAVEHFYPKSRYIDKTFAWDNLLLSCDICNDAGHKGDRFPLDRRGNPLLIDPTDGVTDITEHLEFLWDAEAGLATVYGRDARGKAVEEIFDLNGLHGRRELIKHRSEYVKKIIVLLRFAQAGSEDAFSLLHEACHTSSEYSAFARGLVPDV